MLSVVLCAEVLRGVEIPTTNFANGAIRHREEGTEEERIAREFLHSMLPSDVLVASTLAVIYQPRLHTSLSGKTCMRAMFLVRP